MRKRCLFSGDANRLGAQQMKRSCRDKGSCARRRGGRGELLLPCDNLKFLQRSRHWKRLLLMALKMSGTTFFIAPHCHSGLEISLSQSMSRICAILEFNKASRGEQCQQPLAQFWSHDQIFERNCVELCKTEIKTLSDPLNILWLQQEDLVKNIQTLP